jgi:hypothetical protein
MSKIKHAYIIYSWVLQNAITTSRIVSEEVLMYDELEKIW